MDKNLVSIAAIEKAAKASKKAVKSSKSAQKSAKAKKAPQKGTEKAEKRSYGLSPAEVKAIKAEAGKSFANPYRVGSSYAAVVDALNGLGRQKFHNWDTIISAFFKALGDNAKTFKAKKPRNENGLDANGRAKQAVCVVARADYGKPLNQLGYVVKVDGKSGAGLFKI